MNRRRRRFRDQSILGIVLHMLSSMEPAAAPARTVASHDSEGEAGKGRDHAPALRAAALSRRALILAGAFGMVAFVAVSGVILTKLYQSRVPTAANISALQTPAAVATVPPTSIALAPLAGAPLVQLRTYGGGLLLQPQDALRLPDGDVAVADTGHHRVVLLNASGKLVKQITQGGGGALQAPFSLALTPSHRLMVLDSDAGQIDQYALDGALVSSSDLALHLGHARGIAIDAKGQVLVADPAMNAVVTLSADLTLVGTQAGAGDGSAQLFSQPSAVASSNDGSTYVVDSQNGRILQYVSGGRILHEWPIVLPDTQHSARVVVLSDGRMLASDPIHGALLLFDQSMDQPQSFALPGDGEPLGVALGGRGDVLMTCTSTGEVVDVKVPGLKL